MNTTVIASAPPPGPYSAGLVTGDWIFLAGQPGAGESIEEQTHDAFAKVNALLHEAGATLQDVISCLVHLSDMSLFPRYNKVYENYFKEPRPVRTTVGAALVGDAQVEITVIARLPRQPSPPRTGFLPA
jgi:2-iminobutanoate/2-iminopropanoate deaminase